MLLILKEIYSPKGIKPMRPGTDTHTRVPLGTPPSMMSPSATRQFSASAANSSMNLSRSSSSRISSSDSSIASSRSQLFATPVVSNASPALITTSHPAPSAITSASAQTLQGSHYGRQSDAYTHPTPPRPGPPPLSGFYRN